MLPRSILHLFQHFVGRFALIALSSAALLAQPTQAQDNGAITGTTTSATLRPLPDEVGKALRAAAVPESAVGIVVLPLNGGGTNNNALRLNVNGHVAMNPASTMKLVTTYAALGLLGPAYTWRTEALSAAPLTRDVLEGDLAIRGSGDPKFVIEHLWLLTQRLRAYGIREIAGDVVLDKSIFEALPHDPAQFDGEVLRPYNAGPDALLLNYKAITFSFVPDVQQGVARITAMPPVAGLKLPPPLRLSEGACGDWRARLAGDFSNPLAPRFRGPYPLACGDRHWHVSALTHNAYFAAVFRALWEGGGGVWTGQLREGAASPQARRLALHESETLAEAIRDINKFSNNVMARQLFLTIGAETSKSPGNTERATNAVRGWLAQRGLAMPELVMENGSGLSRAERIAPNSLARLLTDAFNSAVMPEFMASLPLVGVDGTMKSRNGAAGSAHIKTGLLADVRAIAGYVLAASGRRYVVVAVMNHPNAGAAQAAHDALLEWVFRNG